MLERVPPGVFAWLEREAAARELEERIAQLRVAHAADPTRYARELADAARACRVARRADGRPPRPPARDLVRAQLLTALGRLHG